MDMAAFGWQCRTPKTDAKDIEPEMTERMAELDGRGSAEAPAATFHVALPPVHASGFIFSSPHSGRYYPQDFLDSARLDAQALRKSEDCLVDALFAGMPVLGAPLIKALYPRAYLDLNREPYELDPELIQAPLPAHANTQSIRVAGGLGTVARIVADGEEIYASRLALDAVLDRIERYYYPFHAELNRLIEGASARFGYAVLIDCHSMPSAQAVPGGGPRPDVVIGDRFGSSCDPRVVRLMRDAFHRHGYDVAMNRPYAGGFITEHHGRPVHGVHALQIELNRGLYLDERRLTATAGFAAVKADLETIMAWVMTASHDLLSSYRAAAE